MKTSDLLLSGLYISEDEYYYRGMFFLSGNNTAVSVNLFDLQNRFYIEELKHTFKLDEDPEQIFSTLMGMIVEKAQISSKITQGENY